MPPRRSRTVSQLLAGAFTGSCATGCDDPELLRRFLERQDDAAFEAIVRRHGPLVLNVCWGVLRNEADVEDAFQSTFLVLAHNGGAVRKAGSLASWLHGVAFRMACRAREASARRASHLARTAPKAPTEEADEVAWREVPPDRARGVGRHLGAISVPAPALLPGWEDAGRGRGPARGRPEHTQGPARARAGALEARLVRRGLGPAAVALTAAWPFAARAGPPASLITTTVKSATTVAAGGVSASAVSAEVGALLKGGLSTMKFVSAKAAITLALGVVTTMLAVQYLTARAARPPGGQAVPAEAAPNDKTAADAARIAQGEKARADQAAAAAKLAITARRAQVVKGGPQAGGGDEAVVRGAWTAVSGESGGKNLPALRGYRMTFDDGKVTVRFAGETKQGTFKLDPKSTPKSIDLGLDGGTGLGIYSLEGDTLKLCLAEGGKVERPTKFTAEEGARTVLLTMKRAAGSEPAHEEKGGAGDAEYLPQVSVLREHLKAVDERNKALERQFEMSRESIDGVLTKVDAGKNAISIGLKGTKLVLEDAPLSGDATVQLGDRQVAITDLQPGMYVVARLKTDGDRTVVAAVTASKPGE